jgi:hypothetical protein
MLNKPEAEAFENKKKNNGKHRKLEKVSRNQ